jgi:aldehyde dehydrogenase (NAD+)
MSFRTPGEGVQLANNTRYGLAASVWSQDIDTAMDVAKKIKAGSVWINSTNLFDAASGFGGYRESGYGREGGREGMYEVLEKRGSHASVGGPKLPARKAPGRNGASAKGNGLPPAEIDRTFRFLIGGKLARPDGMGSFSVTAPSGKLLAVVGDANRKDVRNAVEAARGASPAWSESPGHNRAQILYFLAENLAVEKERFITGIAGETGCPLKDARSEVDAAIARIFGFAAYADKYGGTVQPVLGRRLVVGLRESVGVIGLRAPDEYPLLGLVTLVASSVAMANTAVVVAGRNALTAVDFIQLVQTSDVPPGVVNILTAEKPDAIAKVLAEHEDVDAVWFFGSAEGSKAVEAASVSNMKQTWVSYGDRIDWRQIDWDEFLRKATQVKNIWVPYGV